MIREPDRASSVPSSSPCPCGSGRALGDCCEPVLQQRRLAATAEELMRSRFTAHVLRDYAHLHRTYLGTASMPYSAENESGAEDLSWSRLVVHTHETGPKPDAAFVDFSAG